MVQKSESAIAQEIVTAAKECMESCNWRLGELAAEWVAKTGGTDAEFGEWIGYSKKQVQQRRAIWEKFGAGDQYHVLKAALSWTHFREALSWDDDQAFEALQWAAGQEATSHEMRCWVASQNGTLSTMMAYEQREYVADEDTPLDDVTGVVPPRAKAETPFEELREAGDAAEESRESAVYQPYRKERITKEKPQVTGGKVKEKCKQPREINPAKFVVAEEVDHVVSICRELGAGFVAANQASAFIRALMVVMEDFAKMAEAEEAG
jgi:hypothetical protein